MGDLVHDRQKPQTTRLIPVQDAVGTVLAHDITEIRPGEFKGRAFKKGHVILKEDVCRLRQLGKEHLFVLHVAEDEMHENEAAYAIAGALMGSGVAIKGEPREGKISIIAERDGLLKIDHGALFRFNMLGEVMCATLHNNTVVKKGQTIAGTRAVPLVIKRAIVDKAVKTADRVRHAPRGDARRRNLRSGVIEVREMRRPKAGVVITGSEVYQGRIRDAFAPVITKKIETAGGELVGVCYAPDDKAFIADRLRELLKAGADLLITTGGMSVDPDDVTRFAIRELGAEDITYGAAVLPGSMFLIAYLDSIPVIGLPACGMYAGTTIFDLLLPRVLAGDRIGRRDVAGLGHGGLCMNCSVCRYPVCPFGKPG